MNTKLVNDVFKHYRQWFLAPSKRPPGFLLDEQYFNQVPK